MKYVFHVIKQIFRIVLDVSEIHTLDVKFVILDLSELLLQQVLEEIAESIDMNVEHVRQYLQGVGLVQKLHVSSVWRIIFYKVVHVDIAAQNHFVKNAHKQVMPALLVSMATIVLDQVVHVRQQQNSAKHVIQVEHAPNVLMGDSYLELHVLYAHFHV